MLVEYQPSTPSRRALKPGARIVFISVWPVLKSLPVIGHAVRLRQLQQRRRVDGQVGRAVRVRDAALERRIRVDLRRRDLRIALGQPLLERRQRRVHGARAAVHLGRPAPHHHQPVAAVVGLEALDVVLDLLGQVGLRLPLLGVRRGQLLDVLLIEHRRHRLDRRQEVLHLAEVLARQHAGLARGHGTRRRGTDPSRRTRSRRASASGTNSLISGDRPSVRLPSRMVPIWVSEPMGLEIPRRIASTPAMKVVATAPIPGVRMPSLPVAGRISGSCAEGHEGFPFNRRTGGCPSQAPDLW